MDQDLCIACGLCVNHCPAVFVWNSNEKAGATAKPVPAESVDCCRQAIDDCPTQAITTA